MFASDVVIILIIFFGVSFILFGKEKNVKLRIQKSSMQL